jgi:hypothetical protein
MVKPMSTTSLTGRRNATKDCECSYNIAEQWLATYKVSHNPRHLDTARICYLIADELYRNGGDHNHNQALMQQIRAESRKRAIEAFAALDPTSRVVDDRDLVATSMEGSRNPSLGHSDHQQVVVGK